MSFPWQNDSAELEAMEELPGGILDSTPSPTPSPASSRATSPFPSPSPEPEIETRPITKVQGPRLPPLMPSHLAASPNEPIGRSNRPIAGRPLKLPSSDTPASSLAPGMQAGPSGSLRPSTSRLPVQSGQTQDSRPLHMPARTLSAVALGKQPCRSGMAPATSPQQAGRSDRAQAESRLPPASVQARTDAYQQASGSGHPPSRNQRPKSNLETTVTQSDSDNDAEAYSNDVSAPRTNQTSGYETDNSEVSYVEVEFDASGGTPVAEHQPLANPTTASQPPEQSGRPRTEGASHSPPAGLSKVALGKQRCVSPEVPTLIGQQASQSGTRGTGSASAMAHISALRAAPPSIYKSKWATPPRYTSKWATAQPEAVPDPAVEPEEDFDAFAEELEEDDIDDGEMSGDEEYMDEDEDDGMLVDEDEDDGMMVDEEEPHQDDDDDGMSLDEEGRAEETEDIDMLVDDPEDEDDDMQVDPEPASAAPQDPPIPPQPSDFQYWFHNPPAPQQQQARVPELRTFSDYFAYQPHPPFFRNNPVLTRQEVRYPQTSPSTSVPAWTQFTHSYKYEQQPYTSCTSHAPYTRPHRLFQSYHLAASRNYARSSLPPVSSSFYPFRNQIPTASYTFAQFEYHQPQVYSGQLRFEDDTYAGKRELPQTQQYPDELPPRQTFPQAFVAKVRRLLKRQVRRDDDAQEEKEKVVNYVENETRKFEENTDETQEDEESESEGDEDNQLQVQILGAYKPDAKQARHFSDARQDGQHEGMLENLAKKTGRLIQENKWTALSAIGLAVYSFAPTLVGLLTSG